MKHIEEHHLVSVVIALYNARGTLEQTVRSVLEQTCREFEVILVDDGSDEEYTDILESLNDNRISYHKLKHSNANVARNYGADRSKGKYIAFLDADDLWLPRHLEDCLSEIQKNKADGLYGSLWVRNPGRGDDREVRVRALKKEESMISYLLKAGYGAQTSTLFLSAESVRRTRWDESLKRHQDYDFVVRYCRVYTLCPKYEPTVIYVASFKTGSIDFESCIKVIERNRNDIEPLLYNRYHQSMLQLANNLNAPESIKKYYSKESVRHLEYVSYAQYIVACNPVSRMERLKYKIKYLLYVLRITVD